MMTLIVVKQWRTCLEQINLIKIYKHANLRLNNSFVWFLLCCSDLRLLNRRHQNVSIEKWQDWIQHLYCSSTLSTVKKCYDEKTVEKKNIISYNSWIKIDRTLPHDVNRNHIRDTTQFFNEIDDLLASPKW